MKNIFAFLFLSLFLGACTTSKIAYQRTGEVVYVGRDGNSTLTVESNGFGSNLNDAVFFAEKNTFENLFFKGVPNSNQQAPMIPNEHKAVQEHAAFFDSFFHSGEYRKYVISSNLLHKLNKKGMSVTQELTVDIAALRKRLEQEKIIRKFGI